MNLKHLIMSTLCVSLLFGSCTEENLTSDLDQFANNQQDEFGPAKRSCGHTEYMNKLLLDPNYRNAHEQKFEKLEVELTKAIPRNCSSPIIIPVAVHFQNVSGTNPNCLKQLVLSQIDILNKHISGTNADIVKWTTQAASYFPGISNGKACVKFCMATKNHPSGYNLSNGQIAMTVNQTNGDQLNAWAGYLNIFVRPNLGFLGEAPLGGYGDGDGVLIDASSFGLGSGCGNVQPEAPFNLGRTTTHEVGHYLLLDHIWGDGCNVDDGVNDTPEQDLDYGGCPILGVKSCGSNDMHMNFMDYTNDACMYMFSHGQAQRMTAYINSSLSNLKNKASIVCDEANTENDDVVDTDDPIDNMCGKIASSSANVISSTMVTIAWENQAGASKYRLRYRIQGSTSWTIKTVSNSEYTINNVSPQTTYQYQLRAQCPNGWVAYSPISLFNTDTIEADLDDETNSCQQNEITLELTLDDYGTDTSWELVDQDGYAISSGGPYQDELEGQKVKQTFCLADGCYTMYIDDQFGDGICCDYGNGKVEIRDKANKVIGSSDGRFGSYTYMDFCLSKGKSRLKSIRSDQRNDKLVRHKY